MVKQRDWMAKVDMKDAYIVFPHSSASSTSEIPVILLEGSDILVPLSPIWPVLFFTGVHKGDEISSGLLE